jgi:hypothetical protein
VEDWFGLELPMEGVKSTSLVFSDLEAIRHEPYACFCAEDAHGCHLELYPRPNGTPRCWLFSLAVRRVSWW